MKTNLINYPVVCELINGTFSFFFSKFDFYSLKQDIKISKLRW